MEFKAILFDLDGTLLDTLEDLGNSVNRVLAERGFPTHDLDRYRYFIGDGATMLITRVLPKQERNNGVIQACVDAFQKDYSRNWKVKTRRYDGIAEMLDELTAQNLKLAVLSNKPHKFTKQCVDELLSSWTFEIVLGQRDAAPRKPRPEGALEIAEHLNAKPKNVLQPIVLKNVLSKLKSRRRVSHRVVQVLVPQTVLSLVLAVNSFTNCSN